MKSGLSGSEKIASPNWDNLKTGLLTDGEINALLTEPGYGLTRPQLTRFATYQDWCKRRATSSWNRCWFTNLPENSEEDYGIYKLYRAFPSFQRLLVVKPQLVTDIVTEMQADEDAGMGIHISEETDRLLYEAYELMADLTDTHDGDRVSGCLNPGGKLPEDQIDPDCLMI